MQNYIIVNKETLKDVSEERFKKLMQKSYYRDYYIEDLEVDLSSDYFKGIHERAFEHCIFKNITIKNSGDAAKNTLEKIVFQDCLMQNIAIDHVYTESLVLDECDIRHFEKQNCQDGELRFLNSRIFDVIFGNCQIADLIVDNAVIYNLDFSHEKDYFGSIAVNLAHFNSMQINADYEHIHDLKISNCTFQNCYCGKISRRKSLPVLANQCAFKNEMPIVFVPSRDMIYDRGHHNGILFEDWMRFVGENRHEFAAEDLDMLEELEAVLGFYERLRGVYMAMMEYPEIQQPNHGKDNLVDFVNYRHLKK